MFNRMELCQTVWKVHITLTQLNKCTPWKENYILPSIDAKVFHRILTKWIQNDIKGSFIMIKWDHDKVGSRVIQHLQINTCSVISTKWRTETIVLSIDVEKSFNKIKHPFMIEYSTNWIWKEYISKLYNLCMTNQ